MSGIKDFIRELRRRRVFRVAAFYIVAGWVAVQVATLGFQAWGLPSAALRYVWIGVTLGFPLAVVFGWYYEISPGGITRTPPPGPGEAASLSLQRPDYIILVVLALFAGTITFGLIGEIRDTEIPGGAAHEQRQTIAVLPLENLTGDPGQDYFVAGMHEALIGNLSKIGSLRVTSRISASRFGNMDMLLPEIARQLGVGKLITGSVARIGDQIRITLQLIDALTDENLWAESYDRNLTDILALQGEVARTVAREIQVKLTAQEETRLSDIRPVDPEVYELYLRGMFKLNRSTWKEHREGLEILHRAVEISPGNARAWAGLANGYVTLGHSPLAKSDTWARARAAAERALKLDPTLAEAYVALATMKLYSERDWVGAEAAFKRANALNPSMAMNHYHYAWYLALFSRLEEAVEEHKMAQALDPFFPLHTAWLGGLYMMQGRFEEAEAEALKALEINPRFTPGLAVLGDSYIAMDRLEEAIAAHEKMVSISPAWQWQLGRTYVLAGRVGEAREIAARLEAQDPTPIGAWGLAMLYGQLGEYDDAFRWLSYEHPHGWLPWARVLPQFAPLRSDPRFDAFLARLNLPR